MWKEKAKQAAREESAHWPRTKKRRKKAKKGLNNQITIDYWQGKSQATKKEKISKTRKKNNQQTIECWQKPGKREYTPAKKAARWNFND